MLVRSSPQRFGPALLKLQLQELRINRRVSSFSQRQIHRQSCLAEPVLFVLLNLPCKLFLWLGRKSEFRLVIMEQAVNAGFGHHDPMVSVQDEPAVTRLLALLAFDDW